MTVHKFESSRKTTVEINEYKHIKRKNMKNNPQKKILRQDGFPIGAEMAKKRYSSAGTTTPFLKQLILTILLFAILPVTALAAEGAPNTLYVGDKSLSVANDSYWTTDADGNLTQSAADQSWNVKYDPSTATLTLKNANISGSFHQYDNPYTAGIYAQGKSNQPVALTIELIGTNTITGTYGIFLNAEIDASSYGTNATLTITGENNGSLGVSGSDHGIYVKSGTGNASINIKNVAVTSSTNGNYAAGVYVMSSNYATNSPNISLSVDGGSLTASGTGSSDGIQFYVGSSEATGATTSLTVSDNAIVDARTGGIKALRGLETLPTPTPTGTGIVFDGSTGTVYGDVTLQDDLIIGAGETLTIPEDKTLIIQDSVTLTNDGTITVEYGGILTGMVNGKQPPQIGQPTNTSVTEGKTAAFTVTVIADTADRLTYQWQQSTDSGDSWADISEETDASYTTGTTTSMNGYQYRCVVTGTISRVSVVSAAATLTVQAKPASVPVIGVTLDKTTLELFTGGSATLTATVEPGNATNQNVTWQSDNADVATVDNGTVTAVGAGETTITVTTEDGGYTASCTVTVNEGVDSINEIIADSTLHVSSTKGMLHIAGTAAEAEVYDVRGVLVYRGTERTIHLPAGTYIVRAEGEVQKAVVK